MSNTIDVSYENGAYRKLAPRRHVLDYISKVLDAIGLDSVEFSLSFIGEQHMHELNREYRGIDDSTDILSFASEDGTDEGFAFVSAGRRKRVLGDILICPEVMARNAETFSVPENEELRRLLIHGVLHLNGEDHRSNDIAAEPMLQRQEELLDRLGP